MNSNAGSHMVKPISNVFNDVNSENFSELSCNMVKGDNKHIFNNDNDKF